MPRAMSHASSSAGAPHQGQPSAAGVPPLRLPRFSEVEAASRSDKRPRTQPPTSPSSPWPLSSPSPASAQAVPHNREHHQQQQQHPAPYQHPHQTQNTPSRAEQQQYRPSHAHAHSQTHPHAQPDEHDPRHHPHPLPHQTLYPPQPPHQHPHPHLNQQPHPLSHPPPHQHHHQHHQQQQHHPQPRQNATLQFQPLPQQHHHEAYEHSQQFHLHPAKQEQDQQPLSRDSHQLGEQHYFQPPDPPQDQHQKLHGAYHETPPRQRRRDQSPSARRLSPLSPSSPPGVSRPKKMLHREVEQARRLRMSAQIDALRNQLAPGTGPRSKVDKVSVLQSAVAFISAANSQISALKNELSDAHAEAAALRDALALAHTAAQQDHRVVSGPGFGATAGGGGGSSDVDQQQRKSSLGEHANLLPSHGGSPNVRAADAAPDNARSAQMQLQAPQPSHVSPIKHESGRGRPHFLPGHGHHFDHPPDSLRKPAMHHPPRSSHLQPHRAPARSQPDQQQDHPLQAQAQAQVRSSEQPGERSPSACTSLPDVQMDRSFAGRAARLVTSQPLVSFRGKDDAGTGATGLSTGERSAGYTLSGPAGLQRRLPTTSHAPFTVEGGSEPQQAGDLPEEGMATPTLVPSSGGGTSGTAPGGLLESPGSYSARGSGRLSGRLR